MSHPVIDAVPSLKVKQKQSFFHCWKNLSEVVVCEIIDTRGRMLCTLKRLPFHFGDKKGTDYRLRIVAQVYCSPKHHCALVDSERSKLNGFPTSLFLLFICNFLERPHCCEGQNRYFVKPHIFEILEALLHCAISRTSCLAKVARNIAQWDIPCNGRKNAARQVAETVAETFCNNFKQPSALLCSHTSPLTQLME